jgi:hypothetical protein
MKKLLVALAVPAALSIGILGTSIISFTPANATESAHVATMSKTIHGRVVKLNHPMGTTESFTLKAGAKTYVVHYDDMTHWVMGSKKDLKVGALISATGTLKGTTLTATKLGL